MEIDLLYTILKYWLQTVSRFHSYKKFGYSAFTKRFSIIFQQEQMEKELSNIKSKKRVVIL